MRWPCKRRSIRRRRSGAALHLYGVVLQDMKLDEASLAPLERARTIGEAALGAEHPVVAQIQQTIGGSLRRLGRYDAAAKEYLASLTKIERAMGTDASEYAAALQNLGTLYLDQEQVRRGDRLSEARQRPDGQVARRRALARRRRARASSAAPTPRRAAPPRPRRRSIAPRHPSRAARAERAADGVVAAHPRRSLPAHRPAGARRCVVRGRRSTR